MPVCRGHPVDRTLELEGFDDSLGREFEVVSDQPFETVGIDLFGSEGVHADGGRLGHSDRVTELHFATVTEFSRHQVLRDVACHVGRAAIDLRRILAAEGAATMSSGSTVGVDDDLSSREPAVSVGSASFEATGRVRMDDDVVVVEITEDGLDDVCDDLFSQTILIISPFRAMLGAQHHLSLIHI